MDKKTRSKIESYQAGVFYAFVPITGIAIFSNNWIFETLAFILGIIFATLSYIDTKF